MKAIGCFLKTKTNEDHTKKKKLSKKDKTYIKKKIKKLDIWVNKYINEIENTKTDIENINFDITNLQKELKDTKLTDTKKKNIKYKIDK